MIWTDQTIQKQLDICKESTEGRWRAELKCPRTGKCTVYGGPEFMYGRPVHGLNLFGRMDLDTNGENNIKFITEAHANYPHALRELQVLRLALQKLRTTHGEVLYDRAVSEARMELNYPPLPPDLEEEPYET